MKKLRFAFIPVTLSLWLLSPVPPILHAQNSRADLLQGERDRSQTRQHPRVNFKVGHRIMKIVVVGAAKGEDRHVDVQLWYPADLRDYFHAPATQYTSALKGKPLDLLAQEHGGPLRWEPLSWSVASLSAREGPSLLQWASKYPVVVFSHGNTNMPIDYAYTLEDLASAGFVVAAPTHVNNSEDDVRMDFANTAAATAGLEAPFEFCLDGLPWSPPWSPSPSPCSHVQMPPNRLTIADRVQDIKETLDALPAELGNRVDLTRVGVFGHSRGTTTALIAAGGSTRAMWNIAAEPRIKAVMGLAIAVRAITFQADFANITQPTLLVSGSLDATSPSLISQEAYERLASTDKVHETIFNPPIPGVGAMHRTFDSTLCDQLRSSAAIAQAAIDQGKSALLDRQTAEGILIHPTSGVAMDYCGFDTFPEDVSQFVESVTGFVVTPTNVPRAGLTAASLRQMVSEKAINFFERVIGHPRARHDFRDDFPSEWLIPYRSNRGHNDEY